MDLDTVTEWAPAPGSTWRDGDAWLGGGTWLFSEPQPLVTRLLDLQAFGWPAVTVTGAGLDVAATCTFAELAAWRAPPDWLAAALFGQCCAALLGSFKVQYAATVGGNICLSLPAGPMIALAVALDATCTIWRPDGSSRSVAVIDFVTGPSSNDLRPAELLRSVLLPTGALRCRTALRRISLTPDGRCAVLVIGRRSDADIVLTVTAATPRPVQFRVPAGGEIGAALDSAVQDYYDDVHGDPRWRAAMTRRLVREVADELSAP